MSGVARAAVEAALSRIETSNPATNAVSDLLMSRALSRADAIDALPDAAALPLLGRTFAAKSLFDVTGLPTRAGSLINRDRPPATEDATLIARAEAAGAILVATVGMGEYAYDFTGENAHDGAVRNPHDTSRMAGGSSSGSAAAVASGMVDFSLGSDTNGSIRVPASFCGVFGLKPTYGRLSRGGSFPFVASLDHVGPFARTARDLARIYDALQGGGDPRDPACADRPAEAASPTLDDGCAGLRIALLEGHFRDHAGPEAADALSRAASALGVRAGATLPEAARARAAAYVITAAEGAALHLDRLRTRAADFDPATRGRLIAGALLPAPFVVRAQRFRRWFAEQVAAVFADYDVLLAPSTPFSAPLIGQTTMTLGGQEVPLRPNIGVFTQPLSFIGLPVAAVPIVVQRGKMPIGVQVIAAPWKEALCLRVARALEQSGIAAAHAS